MQQRDEHVFDPVLIFHQQVEAAGLCFILFIHNGGYKRIVFAGRVPGCDILLTVCRENDVTERYRTWVEKEKI